MALNVICLMKQTFATEAKIALDAAGAVSKANVKEIINPYDEFGIEEAVLWKEAGHVDDITVICVGPEKEVSESVRRGLAMGAEKAIVIDTTGVDDKLIDESVVATAIGKQIAGMKYDVIFCGKVAVDSNAMEVPGRLSEILGVPLVNLVGAAKPEGAKVVAERESDGRQEVFEIELPAMLSAEKSLNKPRYPNLPSIMKAKKKPLDVVPIKNLLGGDPQPTRRRIGLKLPEKKGACVMIGGSPQDAAHELVKVLREKEKVLS